MRKYKNNRQSGMGIIEVLVALGLLAVVGAGLMTLHLNSLKAQKGVEQKNEVQALKNAFQGILGASNCASEMGILDQPIAASLLNFSASIDSTRYKEGDVYRNGTGLSFRQLKVRGLSAGNDEVKLNHSGGGASVQYTKYRGFLDYQMSQAGVNGVEATAPILYQTVTTPVVIFARKSDGKIGYCGSFDTGYNASMCTDGLGGLNDELSSPKCSLQSATIASNHLGVLSDYPNFEYKLKVEDSLGVFSTNVPGIYLFKTAQATSIASKNSNTVSSITVPNPAQIEIRPMSSNGGAKVLLSPVLASFDMPVSMASGLRVTGDITASGIITASSDVRLKSDIKPLANNLAKVLRIQPVEFVYKSDSKKEKNIGFIAQDLKVVLPETVREDSKGFLSVAYGNLSAVIWGALQEHYLRTEDQNQNLNQRIEKLEKQLQNLEKNNELCVVKNKK